MLHKFYFILYDLKIRISFHTDFVHNFKDLTKNSADYLTSSCQVLEDGIMMISSARRSFSLDADFYEIEVFIRLVTC